MICLNLVYLKLIASSRPYISDVWYRFRILCMLMWNFQPLSLSASLNIHWPFMEWLVWYFLLSHLFSLVSTTLPAPSFHIFFLHTVHCHLSAELTAVCGGVLLWLIFLLNCCAGPLHLMYVTTNASINASLLFTNCCVLGFGNVVPFLTASLSAPSAILIHYTVTST